MIQVYKVTIDGAVLRMEVNSCGVVTYAEGAMGEQLGRWIGDARTAIQQLRGTIKLIPNGEPFR